MKKIYIAADHAGYKVKEQIKNELGDSYEFVDLGTDSEASVDYPEYGKKLAEKVTGDADSQGVLICGSGIGISIAANKVRGARSALCYSKDAAQSAREHNNANIVSVPGRSKAMDNPVEIVKTFLETDFSTEERHARRVDQMMDIEND